MSSPQTIFFDMDETLIENTVDFPHLFRALYGEFEAELGTDNYALFIDHFRAQAPTLWATMFEHSISPEAQLEQLYADCIFATKSVNETQARQLGQRMFAHFVDTSSAQVRFNPGAEELMATLRARGFSTGLITNGIEAVQLGKIKALKLDEKLDSITISAQARAHKPTGAVFRLALSRSGIGPEHAWQVGDHVVNDVSGGIRAGLGGVFYNPKGVDIEHAFRDVDERPTHTIARLIDLLELI